MKENQKEIIKAWIDGEVIQYKLGSDWSDCNPYEECTRVYFNDGSIYRIKPKNIVKTTFIEQDGLGGFQTFSFNPQPNLRMTFSPEGKLLKAEVI